MTSPDLLEALRSGAVRVVPVEATDEMAEFIHDDADVARHRYAFALAASPDHTPDLVALIEGRAQSHCCVEDASEPCGPFMEVCKERDAALAERDALRERVERAEGFILKLVHMQSGQGWTRAVVRGAAANFLESQGISIAPGADTTPEMIARALTQETNGVEE